MFNNGARSQVNQNLNKLFDRELAAKRNFYLCLVAIAVVASGIGGMWLANRINPGKATVEANRQLATAAVMPNPETLSSLVTPSEKSNLSELPIDREELISKVWSCQLNWTNKIESPEKLSTEQLQGLLSTCELIRSGGDS